MFYTTTLISDNKSPYFSFYFINENLKLDHLFIYKKIKYTEQKKNLIDLNLLFEHLLIKDNFIHKIPLIIYANELLPFPIIVSTI